MSELETIEKAVASLPAKELAEFGAGFEAFAAERFDAAIERDAKSGALDRLAKDAAEAFRDGRAKELYGVEASSQELLDKLRGLASSGR